MCHEIPTEQKLQASKCLPDGWGYYFADLSDSRWTLSEAVKKLDGLVCLGSRRYYSIEAAMSHTPRQFKKMDEDPTRLYLELGLALSEEDKKTLRLPRRATAKVRPGQLAAEEPDTSADRDLSKRKALREKKRRLEAEHVASKRSRPNENNGNRVDHNVPHEISTEESSSMTSQLTTLSTMASSPKPRSSSLATKSPRELHERQCGRCFMCRKPDCTGCQTCKNNSAKTRPFREVCLRKVGAELVFAWGAINVI